MYSYEDRIRAVKYYIACGFNAAFTVKSLGYPDPKCLKLWYQEYLENNELHYSKKSIVSIAIKKKEKL